MPIDLINGTPLFHHETGSGEPLVLVHGAWSDHTSCYAVVPGLAETFRVITYDLRGHGKSALEPPDAGTVHDDIDDLVALVAHLSIGPANVAGTSSGASIARRVVVPEAGHVPHMTHPDAYVGMVTEFVRSTP